MVSPPPSPPSSTVAFNEPENDHPSSPPLSPKRSFADESDDATGSFGYFKRRHVHTETEATRRVPLDPLSASEIDNRPRLHRDPIWPESSFHSLGAESESRSCDANRSIPTQGTEDEAICSWPPAVQSGNSDGTAGTNRTVCPQLVRIDRCSSDARESCRASAVGSALGWPPPSRSRSPERRTSRGWDVDKMTQSIRPRSSFMPYVRRPPGELWKAEISSDQPARTIYNLLDDRNSIFDSPPPGPAKRRGSESDVTGRRSWSLSLASDSQPMRADESSKVVPPIGAERSRVVSMTPRRSKSLPPAELPLSKADGIPQSRLKSNSTWRNPNNTHLLENSHPPTGDAPKTSTFDSSITAEEFNRLLQQAVHNKHAPKVFSPLGPLRNPPPSSFLTSDPTYQRYLPSKTKKLSKRFTKGSELRVRNLCDLYQPCIIDLECSHCQECKRDTIGKRLLVSQYRQKRQHALSLLTSPVTFITGSPLSSLPSGIDKDERSLWEEVALASTSSIEPFPASPHLQDLHDFSEDDDYEDDDDYPEIPDEDLLSDREDVVLGRGEHLLKFD